MHSSEHDTPTAARKASILDERNKFRSLHLANKNETSSNSNNIYTISYLIKSSIKCSLPHLAILTLFIVYTLLGATILKEIESDYDGNFKATRRPIDETNKFYENKLDDKNTKQNVANSIKLYSEKTSMNLNSFHANYEKMIENTLNLTNLNLKNTNPEDDDTETFEFFSKLFNKHKNNMNVEKMFKSIAKHVIQFKFKLKTNLTHNLHELVGEFAHSQNQLNNNINALLKGKLKNADEPKHSHEEDMTLTNSENSKWKFTTYVYFIGSLLTTMGYGNASPKTIIGKIFTMIYVIIGLPITLILLSDLGSIITRFVKFFCLFIYTIYKDGYYESVKKRLHRRKTALIDKLKSKKRRKSSIKKPSSSDDEDEDTKILEKPDDEQSLFRSLIDIGQMCIDQTNDLFDLSLGFSFGFVFFYLSLGAFITSRIAQCSLFNGYYFSLITLTKIGLGDLLYNNQSHLTVFTSIYILVGIAYFDLIILSLQEKIRILLIRNAKNIIGELIKFANQLGYAWSIDSFNFDNLGKHSINKIIYSNKTSNTNSVSDLDFDDVFFTTRTTSNVSLRSRRNDPKGINYHEISKCDKQTQITTLLCSKFKYEKSGLSSSLSSIPESVSSAVTLETISPNENPSTEQKEKLELMVDDKKIRHESSNALAVPSSSNASTGKIISTTRIEVISKEAKDEQKSRRSRFSALPSSNSSITTSYTYKN